MGVFLFRLIPPILYHSTQHFIFLRNTVLPIPFYPLSCLKPLLALRFVLNCCVKLQYTGITPDLKARLEKHRQGKGAVFTRINRPVRMLAAMPCRNRSEASRLEWKVKRLTPEQKRYFAMNFQHVIKACL